MRNTNRKIRKRVRSVNPAITKAILEEIKTRAHALAELRCSTTLGSLLEEWDFIRASLGLEKEKSDLKALILNELENLGHARYDGEKLLLKGVTKWYHPCSDTFAIIHCAEQVLVKYIFNKKL